MDYDLKDNVAMYSRPMYQHNPRLLSLHTFDTIEVVASSHMHGACHWSWFLLKRRHDILVTNVVSELKTVLSSA
jgi:hypothetical protein